MAAAGAGGRGAAGRSRGERELAVLLEVSRSLTATLELGALLDLILEQLLRVLNYRSAGIIVARGEAVETVAMRDTVDRARERVQVGYRVPLTQFAGLWQPLLRGEPVLIGDVRREDDSLAQAWRNSTGYLPDPSASPVRAWLGLPRERSAYLAAMLPSRRLAAAASCP